jgi:phosphatidylglycerophosphate synthase
MALMDIIKDIKEKSDYINSKAYDLTHPNRISAYGALFSISALFALGFDAPDYVAPSLCATGALCDFIDGKVARYTDRNTLEGKKVDPMMDKIKQLSYGVFMSIDMALEYGLNIMAGYVTLVNTANSAVDLESTLNRGPLKEQLKEVASAIYNPNSCTIDVGSQNDSIGANWYGKWKTGLQNTAQFLFVLGESFDINNYEYGAAFLLTVSAFLGYKGVQKRKNIAKNLNMII